MSRIFIIFALLFCPGILISMEAESFYLERGKIQYREQMLRFARESFDLALRVNPDSAEAHAYLGRIALRNDDKHEALSRFNRAASLGSLDPEIFILSGEVEDFFGNGTRAQAAFTRALELQPDAPRALLGLARQHFITGDATTGTALFTRCRGILTDKSAPLLTRAREQRATRKFKTALYTLERAAAINPADKEIYLEIDSLCRETGDRKTSLKHLERYRYLDPTDAEILVRIANLFLTGGMYRQRWLEIDTGLNTVRRAIVLTPDNAELYALEAAFLKLKGDADGAAHAEKKFRDRAGDE